LGAQISGHKPEEVNMPVANINGVGLNYEVSGQGKAVVCVHGLTGSHQDWSNQIIVLSPKYRVVTIDLRGHGKSAAPSGEKEYSIPIFANDIFAILETLDIKKCCLIGHSIGGFISLQFSLDHPDMLSALVLVGTNSGGPPKPPGFLEHRQKLHELARSQGMEAAFEYDAANNPQRIEAFRKHPEQREMMRQRVLATSANGYIHAWKAIDRWEPLTPRLSEIQVPTLIYWGDEDVSMADGIRILRKGIANSELITVQGVGHSPHYESPKLFNRKLMEFLTRIGW
jgi:3-oxoadipate enol-lactonase